ncbi:Brain-specific homeobox, partial [Operophtera brumata]
MESETRSGSPDSNRQEHSKTSFLIEDILYRGQKKVPVTVEQRRFEFEPKPYFPVPSELRPHVPAREGSYLQHCRRRKARTVFSDPQLTGEIILGLSIYHALFTPSELSLSALKHCRRRKARTVFSDPQLT